MMISWPLTRSEKITILNEGERPTGSAVSIFEDIEIFVPMKGLVDVAKETERLDREKGKVLKNLQGTEGKLANEKFLANAPDDVVAKVKEKQEGLQATLAKIEDSLKRIAELS